MEEVENEINLAQLCQINDICKPHLQFNSYKGTEVIYFRQSKITHLGIVVNGLLKAVDYTFLGAELCHAYFEKDDIFPEFLYFSGRKEYSYSLIAVKRSVVAWLPIDFFESLIYKDKEMIKALITYISNRSLKNQMTLNCLNYQTIRERLAYWILGVHNGSRETWIEVPCSQSIWANMLHVSRSSLNQELKAMEREGYFVIEGNRLVLSDYWKLETLI